MNWVGGVRNRLKTKDEKQRQKDFFEKMKYGSKMKKLKRSSSGKEGSLGASLDLLSLQAADFSAEKFRKSDSVKSTKTQVKKVELDRSRGLFPLHHRCEEMELSMSPGAPSKLQLQDPDQRNTDYPHSKEHTQTAYSSFTTPSAQLEYDTYEMKTGEAPKTEYSDCQSYPSNQSSSQFHSTPVVEEFPQAPVPQQHRGKHFEDLFFSCIPNDTLTIKKEVPDDLFVISDEQLSEEFDYSPLSSIPSESSAASSLIMLNPDFQPTFEHDQMPVHSSRPGQQFQNGGLHSSPIDLTQYTIGPRDNEITKHPISDTSHSEDWVLDSSLTTVCDRRRESHHEQRQQEDSVSTVQQVDLICEEEGDFLSPFCKRAKVSSRKTRQENPASPEISTSPASSVDLSNTINRGKATEEQNSLKKEDVRSVRTEANSFKWKAFVSGHAFREKPVIENKDRPISKAPAKAMSKVCEQVLKEVLQLDNDLCQQSPLLQGSISQPVVGFQLSTKLEMEKFSSQVTEGTGNRHSVHSPDQQVPIQGIQLQMESPGCLTVESSELQQDNDAEPIQNDKERCDNKEEEDESPRLVMSCDVKPEWEGLPDVAETTYEVAADPIPSDNKHDIETLESGEKQNGPPASGPSRMMYEEKATQCNILIAPTEDRATLSEIQDFTNAASASGCSKAEQLLAARGSTDKPKPMCDAYDECIVS